MNRSVFKFFFVFALLAALGMGCDDGDSSSNNNNNGKLQSVSGKLTVDDSKTDGEQQAKVIAMVGDKKIPAELDAVNKGFVINDLPEGSVTILVDLGTGPLPVKFSKAQDQLDTLTSLIPEVSILASELEAEAAAAYNMELGALVLSDDGTYLVPEFNPFSYLDTDLDGMADWLDDDLDGDGVDNWDDTDPWGADFGDWGWDDETWDAWDEDGDGMADWEDDDWMGDDSYWGMDEFDAWDVCDEDDADCWSDVCDDPDLCLDDDEYCIIFPEDPFCEGTLDCDLNPTHPYCQGVDCDADPDNPACQILDECIENPAHPDCRVTYCTENPTEPQCLDIDGFCMENETSEWCSDWSVDDYCLENPLDELCSNWEDDYCLENPDDPACEW